MEKEYKVDTQRMDKNASKKNKNNLPYSKKHVRFQTQLLESKNKIQPVSKRSS